jgi:hypothetical protein
MHNNVHKIISSTRNFIIVVFKKEGEDSYLNNELFAIILTGQKTKTVTFI